jgi:hypothetical protein
MARIHYHRGNPPSAKEAEILKGEEADCEIGEDEEVEVPDEKEQEPVVMKPGMSPKGIKGLDEEITPIEKWQASVLAHDAAVEDRRIAPDVEDHPDGNESTKKLKKLEKAVLREVGLKQGMGNRDRWVNRCPALILRQGPRRA